MNNIVKASLAALSIGQAVSLNAQKPNFIIMMTDQQRADLTEREGYPLDLTPFADRMGQEGAWFSHAYTSCPASAPARISMLTGRFPRYTRADSNHNIDDAFFGKDLFTVAKEAGYQTILVGKNHTYMTKESADWWIPFNHLGEEGSKDGASDEDRGFDEFLEKTSFYASMKPSPYGVEHQIPYRMVTKALEWIKEHGDEKPFVMILSFPEPHNPYQVCEPYFSMYDGKIPPARTDSTALDIKGEKFRQLYTMMSKGHKGFSENIDRLRANYMGMIRLLDDQMERFVDGVKALGEYDSTTFVITSDHGDYAGEYGLMKKGAGVVDAITRIPMVWFGNGVVKSGERADHISIVDIMPTACEKMGMEIPQGVQGRSLTEMLAGRNYPIEEFSSIISEAGFGGQYITKEDRTDYIKEGSMRKNGLFFDELNTWSQSGTISMVRKGDWKLVMDMHGKGELYNMKKDPSEMDNLFGSKKYLEKKAEMMQELLKWEIGLNDPIPVPRHRYHFKRYDHNYLFAE